MSPISAAAKRQTEARRARKFRNWHHRASSNTWHSTAEPAKRVVPSLLLIAKNLTAVVFVQRDGGRFRNGSRSLFVDPRRALCFLLKIRLEAWWVGRRGVGQRVVQSDLFVVRAAILGPCNGAEATNPEDRNDDFVHGSSFIGLAFGLNATSLSRAPETHSIRQKR